MSTPAMHHRIPSQTSHAAGEPGSPAPPAVRDAGGTLRDDLRAARMVWKRELIRFARNRVRAVMSLAQPILFLFVLGTGLSSLLGGGAAAGGDYRTFMFPGVILMTVLFTSIFSAVSIVRDREFGFLREMLVAPIHRSAILLGKCAGGATVATIQGAMMLALAGLAGVPYSPILLLTLIAEIALASLALTALGLALAARIKQVEAFQVVMQVIVLPMFFLSGAIFPIAKLPAWLAVLTRIDPLSYAMDAMRRAVLTASAMPPGLVARLNPGVTWFGWRVATGVELALVAGLGALLLGLAVVQFSRSD